MFDLTVVVFVVPFLLAMVLLMERTRLGCARIRQQIRMERANAANRMNRGQIEIPRMGSQEFGRPTFR